MAACLVGFVSFASAMNVERLRCEYAADPIGIDTLEPRLSWVLSDAARGQRQTAYQIRVAESPEALDDEKALLWDTGKVVASENVHIVYAGKPLHAGQRCYWKVRAWDKQDQPSAWSKPAVWQVALLNKSDWQAKWIGPAEATMPGWGDMTLAADVQLQQNAFGIIFHAKDANNFYMWQFNAKIGGDFSLRPHVLKDGQWNFLPAVSLRKFVPAGEEMKPHRIEIETRGDQITTRIDGKTVDTRRDASLAAGSVGFRADAQERFVVTNLKVSDAQGKTLLSDDFKKPSQTFLKGKIEKEKLAVNGAVLLHCPPLPKDCPRLRKTFTLDKNVRRATASVCGLGFYELYMNGRKAGDRVLAPANTSYGQRLLFDTIDVTAQVKKGENAVGLWLAPGYSDDYSQWGWKWESGKRAICQLDVVFDDGTAQSIATDGSWTVGPSPLAYASLYHGEIFDAQQESPDWATAAFDAKAWKPAEVLSPTAAAFKPNVAPPVRVCRTIRPVSVAEPKPGVFVFDMGQAFAGWVRLKAKGPAGTRIVLHHSELVDKNGMLDSWTNRNAKATDTFILKGEGAETYEPRFTYHGFRYVEVTGYPGRPTADDVTGCVVHTDAPDAGTFSSSDKLLNRVYQNCVWSMRSNQMSVPTDCCMRDERTPCQMDSVVYEDAAMQNFWLDRYYAKWLDDISGGSGNPDWNGDSVLLPWRLYREYGDRRILEKHYPAMQKFVEWLHAKSPTNIWTDGFGDWCRPNNNTWEGFHGDVTDVNTTLYAALAKTVADAAAVLGKTDDAARFNKLAGAIQQSLIEKRFDPKTGAFGNGSQTASIMPLALGLVPDAQKPTAVKHLLATIQGKDKNRLDTGIFGTRYLLDVLADCGSVDLGLRLLMTPDYPSFGNQIAQGATTCWEQWAFKGGMHSHNHAMFAGVSEPFFSRLAGITPLKPGYAEIGIRPVVPTTLTFVEASQETVRGRIFVRWQRDGQKLSLHVTIPANATARIAVPTAVPETVTENGRPAAQSEGVAAAGVETGYAVFTVGSGDYHFASQLPQ